MQRNVGWRSSGNEKRKKQEKCARMKRPRGPAGSRGQTSVYGHVCPQVAMVKPHTHRYLCSRGHTPND
eukprot:1156781-Pelagomonas_calceolata.AAC.3